MLNWMRSKLLSQHFEYETDRRLVLAVLGVSLLAMVLLFIANISRELVFVLILALAAAFTLALRGNLKIAGIFGPMGGLVVCTLLVFRNFGIRDTAILGLPMVIVAASLINGQMGAILSGFASLIVVMGLGLAEFNGVVHNSLSSYNTLADYSVVCVVIIMTVAMQWAVLERLMENIHMKQRELNERLRAEQEKTAYALEMEALYQLSLDLSELPPEKSLDEFFAQKLKELTGAFFVSLAEYNPAGQCMETRQVIVDSHFLNRAIHLIGGDPRAMKFPVDEETYQQMIHEVVGYRSSLTEVTFGAIPPSVGATLQTIFNIEHFIGMAILYNGELEATLVIALQKGKAVPSHRFLQALANLAAVAFWRKRSETARLESETRFQQMAELLPQGVFECSRAGLITYANQAAVSMLGFISFTGERYFMELFRENQQEFTKRTFQALVDGIPAGQHEFLIARKDGSVFPALIYSSPIIRNGQKWGIRGVVVDISELARVEQNLQRTNRFLRATSRCNLALVHASDRQSLFDEICSTLVEEIGYSFVWIGLFEEGGESAVKPAAYAGLQGARLNLVKSNCGLSALECNPMLETVQHHQPVVITDIANDLRCQVCREEALAHNLKSMISLPLIYSGKIFGGITVYSSQPGHFSPEEIKVLQEMSSDVAFGMHTMQLRADRDQTMVRLEEVNQQLISAYDITLQGWSKALELRERETAGHSQRVVRLTLALAEKMGLQAEELSYIRWGAYLHDIGKIGIPDSILLKPAPLTEDEWKVMRQHPVYAHRLISSISFLKGAAEIPHLHHERWNGSGYPFQLKGEAIPLPARIFAVVDVWDALIYDRPYRPAWSIEDTRDYLHQNAGTLFDPKIIAAFLDLIDSESKIDL